MSNWGKRWEDVPVKYKTGSGAPSRPKYGNEKTVINGITFDSKREAEHYQELWLRERAGEISELKCQVPFAIVIDNRHICDYIADFTYVENISGWQCKRVVDAKGVKTDVYRLKKKLMLACLGIEITEV